MENASSLSAGTAEPETAAAERPEAGSLRQRVAVLCGFHHDVAYLKRCADYLPDCVRILDEALEILRREPAYRFLVEQVFLLRHYWQERPRQRTTLVRLAQEGRLEVAPGMYVMPDLNLPSGEALFRQVEYGWTWLEDHLGIRPRVCWIADCWGHPAQLPQMLRQCGYSHYVFWRCMRPEVTRASFRWRGLDGSVLPAHWLPFGYGTLRFAESSEAVNALDLQLHAATPEAIHAMIAQLRRYIGTETPLLVNGGDMARPQPNAPGALRTLNASQKNLHLDFTSLADFLDGIDWPNTPIVDGEFNSSLQGTFTSNIHLKQRNRTLTQRLLAAETLAVVLGKPPSTDPWPLLLKQQFHDIICGTICDQALAEAEQEFDHVEAMIAAVVAEVTEPAGEAMLFNSLPFARHELVGDAENPSEVSLPAFGFAAPRPLARIAPQKSLPLSFETDAYAARIGADGHLDRLVMHHASPRNLIAPEPAPFGSLAMQIDQGDLWLPFDAPLSGGSMESALTRNLPDPYDRSRPGELVHRRTLPPQITSARVLPSPPGMLQVEQSGVLRFWRLSLTFTTRILFRQNSRRIEFQTTFVQNDANLTNATSGFDAGGYGSEELAYSVTATWTADATSQAFRIAPVDDTSNHRSVLNALSLYTVPEPSTALLLGLGSLATLLLRTRRK